jgi:hypothetical protein
VAQLPSPGGNANNWGTMLNDYLQQALAADGTLVTSATNSYTSAANTNLATNAKPGLVQLAGDIGNTYSAPKVTGLQGRAVSTNTPSDGEVLTWDNIGGEWIPQAVTGGSGGSGFIGDIDGGSASSTYTSSAVIDCGGA